MLIRELINELLDKVEDEGLPVPFDINLNRGERLDINWMLQEDLEGSRAVLRAYDGWAFHSVSKPDEPCLVHFYGPEQNEVTLWAHPGSLIMKPVEAGA